MLDLDEDVVTGVYPRKTIDWTKVKRRAQENPNISEDELHAASLEYNLNVKDPNKVLSKKGFIEVLDGATGFMLIKRKVFLEIIKQRPEIKYRNDVDGYQSYGDNFYDFFPAKINPKTKKFESEDYGFCNLWKSCGGKIHAIPAIELSHYGGYKYQSSFQEQLNLFN